MSTDEILDTAVPADPRGGRPSASGLERLRACPGSWLAEGRMPAEEPSADAAAGTRLHRHMELVTFPEDPEEREACEWCHKTRDVTVADLMRSEHGEAPVYEREMRLWERDRMFSGAVDVLVHWGRSAVIFDYKFGRIAVPPSEQNMQLAAYSLLVFDNYADVETVYAGILQPFVSREEPGMTVFHREAVESMRAYLADVIARAEAEDAPLRPSERACRYCRAATVCPAAAMAVQRFTAMDVKQAWTLWNAEQRRRAYDAAKMAERLAKRILDQVRADLRAEVEIPGLTLGEGRRTFTVEDAAGAFRALSDTVSAEEFTGCCKVQIGDLDRLVHAKLKAGNEKQRVADSKEFVRTVLAPFGQMKVTEGTIKEVRV